MRILLAEDDDSISTIVKIALERIGGHQVTLARDGHAALQTATGFPFDLILLDGMMPGKDGLRVCKELRQVHGLKTPIIFVSARNQECDIRESLENGAIGYISKPFDPKKICEQIETLLDRGVRVA